MTNTLTRPADDTSEPELRSPRHGRRRTRLFSGLVLLIVAALVLVAVAILVTYHVLTDDSGRDYLGSNGWPTQGQAAISLGAAGTEISPEQRPAPIASVAKVMTAYLVLQERPLADGDGFTLRISRSDERRTERERSQDQSYVPVRAGEELTERQALAALLLPSANNVAGFLAKAVSGSERAFVARMNATAHRLGMTHTRYADASGFDPRTVSTAADQLILARTVARDATFSRIVAMRSASIPVAGTITNTDTLLGRDGFVGTKTGSHDAAGGCFMFRATRRVNGQRADVVGVVLGQRGHNLIDAGLYAARQLVNSLTSPV